MWSMWQNASSMIRALSTPFVGRGARHRCSCRAVWVLGCEHEVHIYGWQSEVSAKMWAMWQNASSIFWALGTLFVRVRCAPSMLVSRCVWFKV